MAYPNPSPSPSPSPSPKQVSPEARRPPKAPWQELQRHEIPQQKWTTAESRLLAHLVTQHTDAKGHPMWIRIAPLLNGRTPQACSGSGTRGCSHAHVGGCTPRMQGCNLMHDRLQPTYDARHPRP